MTAAVANGLAPSARGSSPGRSLVLRNLRKEYTAGKPVLRDVSVDFADSGVTAIIGPSGTGTSTRRICLETVNGARLITNLSAALQSNDAYMDRLIALSNRLSTWITEAQTSGQLAARLPPELVLYTLFARACDPVVALLKDSGQYTHAQIIDWVTSNTFDGMAG